MHSKFLLLVVSFLVLIAVAVSLLAADTHQDDITSLAAINAESHSIYIDIPIYSTDASGNVIPNGTVSGNAALKCETSLASPWVWDITSAANKLRSDRMCQQTNGIGSHCKELARHGGASIAICGTWMALVRCHVVASAADEIGNYCAWNDRAGGKWRFPDGSQWWLETIVY
jgi:hypothetical protein